MFARDWNSKYPRGTKVRFWPRGRNSTDKPIETEVRASAYHLGSGTLIIPLANGRNARLADVEPVVVISAQSAPPVAYP
jgi:hypothetical protein